MLTHYNNLPFDFSDFILSFLENNWISETFRKKESIDNSVVSIKTESNERGWCIMVGIPGSIVEEFDVHLEKNILEIKYLSEQNPFCKQNEVSKSWTLPENSIVNANFKNSVLQIDVKREKEEKRLEKIDIVVN